MPVQIQARFSPAANNGYTTTNFTDGQLETVHILIGVRRGATLDIDCLAAHEFGHGLGIDGHSDDRCDVMYPVHQIGHSCRITARDRNTLGALYPFLFPASTPAP